MQVYNRMRVPYTLETIPAVQFLGSWQTLDVGVLAAECAFSSPAAAILPEGHGQEVRCQIIIPTSWVETQTPIGSSHQSNVCALSPEVLLARRKYRGENTPVVVHCAATGDEGTLLP
jgi:hypothetical protein